MRRFSAATVFLLTEGLFGLGFGLFATYFMVYMVVTVQLDPLELILVGTALEGSILLFEVPTGVVADVYGRKRSVVMGMFLIGLGMMLSAAFTSFYPILLTQALWGFGYTFISGALQAWITDEVGEANAGKLFLRASQVGSVIGIGSIVLATLLVNIHIRVPIVLGGAVVMFISFMLAAIMPETQFVPHADAGVRNPFAMMGGTLKDGVVHVRGNAVLLLLVAVSFIGGVWSEGYDRLWQAHLVRNIGLPSLAGLDELAWFGVLGVIVSLVSLVATEAARRRINTANQRRLAQSLIVLHVVMAAAVLMFAAAGGFAVGVLAYMTISVVRGVIDPLLAAWRNLNIRKEVRATVLSMASQMDAFGQLFSGPIIGLIGRAYGLRTALAVAGLLIAPAVVLFLRTMRHHRRVIE